ncbi:hypothetical protein [Streptomyces spinoverrucosus]|uniref:hypothetical protein n=1 Tax=Streptomyces spinoverrucosus TaxID=284043 RepID=UPI0035AF925E
MPRRQRRYTNGDGILNNTEATVHYGDSNIALTVSGDTDAATSGLAVDRMPVAGKEGKISCKRTIPVSQDVVDHIKDLHVVQHGIDRNDNGKYDFEGAGKSELDPKLPQEATAPTNCGEVKGAAVGPSRSAGSRPAVRRGRRGCPGPRFSAQAPGPRRWQRAFSSSRVGGRSPVRWPWRRPGAPSEPVDWGWRTGLRPPACHGCSDRRGDCGAAAQRLRGQGFGGFAELPGADNGPGRSGS